MRRLAVLFMFLCVATLAACGGSSAAATPTDTTAPAANAPTAPAATATTATTGGTSSAAKITMGLTDFTSGDVTIKAGQAVTFDDSGDNAGSHDLVTGTNGQFSAMAGAPKEFASQGGISFPPGTVKTITFPTAGTFTITCTFHPSMLVKVTVTP